jgi:hypothetical protein
MLASDVRYHMLDPSEMDPDAGPKRTIIKIIIFIPQIIIFFLLILWIIIKIIIFITQIIMLRIPRTFITQIIIFLY